jgi:hypothetical protein
MNTFQNKYLRLVQEVNWSSISNEFTDNPKDFALALDLDQVLMDDLKELVENLQLLQRKNINNLCLKEKSESLELVFGKIFRQQPASFARYYYLDYYYNNESRFGLVLREFAKKNSVIQNLCSAPTFRFLSEVQIFLAAYSLEYTFIVAEQEGIINNEWNEFFYNKWIYPRSEFDLYSIRYPFCSGYDSDIITESLIIFWSMILLPEENLKKISRQNTQSSGLFRFDLGNSKNDSFLLDDEEISGDDLLDEYGYQYKSISESVKGLLNKTVKKEFSNFEDFFDSIIVNPRKENKKARKIPGYIPSYNILPFTSLNNLSDDTLKEMEEWFDYIFLFDY